MARKVRPDPFEQGVLRTIYMWFLGPLVKHKPHQWTLAEFYSEVFHLRNRDITRWVVTRDFTMPGLLYIAGAVKIQGTGYRSVQPGEKLWVRIDANTPNSVDVEWIAQADQTFQLSTNEWDWVKLHCDEEIGTDDDEPVKPRRRRKAA